MYSGSEKNKKLLIISNSVFPSQFANANAVIQMANSFSSHFNTYLIGSLRLNNFQCILNKDYIFEYYGVKKKFKILLLPSLARFPLINNIIYKLMLKFIKPDFVYTRVLEYAVISVQCSHSTVFEQHSPIHSNDLNKFKFLIRNDKCEAIVFITNWLRKWFINNNLGSNKQIVLPSGSKINNSIKDGYIFNELSNVGYSGSVQKGRGIEFMLDLASSLPLITFNIYGGSRKNIKNIKKHNKIPLNIHLHGYLSPVKLIKALTNMDCLIAPYSNAVFIGGGGRDTSKWMSPIKIFEYMAMKKPIVCSDIPVLREVLIDGYNALLCPPDNKECWKKAIERLGSDKILARNITKNSYHMLKNKYTWKIRTIKIIRKAKWD